MSETKEKKKNVLEEKMNVALAIGEIGKGKKVTLFFDKNGNLMIEGGGCEYCPENQKKIPHWDYKTSLTVPKDCEGDWPKYAAEDMLSEIDKRVR